ncbi:MAG: Protease 3 [Chlamydiia bacterium]|nr:Protease 3 [Chlamydiia bacterium]
MNIGRILTACFSLFIFFSPLQLLAKKKFHSIKFADKKGVIIPPLYTEIKDENPLAVLTPSLQNITTKKIVLYNGIKVFLVSDPKTAMSGASLAVNVGQWNDHKDYPGIAHFCEHMLFMGSEKYPDENAYLKYITDGGGTRNAYTANDQTVYTFSIENSSLDIALDMFSRFFIDPLFKAEGIEREIHAVDNEFLGFESSDGWRLNHIQKWEGNKEHPNHKFSVGNKKTLEKISRDDLLKWHKKHYLPTGMNLVVYSNKKMEQLIKLVVDSFKEVKSCSEKAPQIEYKKITAKEQEGHITYMEPLQDIKEINITWEAPKDLADYDSMQMIAHCISNQGEDSLSTHLKKKGLIVGLFASQNIESLENTSFQITMLLTNDGMEKREEVIGTVFAAINKLKEKDIPKYVWDDLKSSLTNRYQWMARPNVYGFVQDAASSLYREAFDTFPYKLSIIGEIDKKICKNFLEFLTPHNAIIVVIGSSEDTGQVADKVEPVFGTKYSISKIDRDTLTTWEEIAPLDVAVLPRKNAFLSNDLKLFYDQDPSQIASSSHGTCYLWIDDHYHVPRIQVITQIKSPAINATAKSLALTQLYTSYINYHLANLLAEATFAETTTSISVGDLSLIIYVDSYHDAASSYMVELLTKIKDLSPDQDLFNNLKEQILVNYKNFELAPALSRAWNILYSKLLSTYQEQESAREILESLTLDDLKSFHEEIFHENFLEVFICGNTSAEKAIQQYSEIKERLSAKKAYQDHDNHSEFTPIHTEKDNETKRFQVNTRAPGNAALLVLDGGPSTNTKKAAHKILGTIMGEAFFDSLRSQQQTGYCLQSATTKIKEQLIQYFLVQSPTHLPDDLIERYDLFLKEYTESLEENIPEKRFLMVKDSIISKNEGPIKTLQGYAWICFDSIYTDKCDFTKGEQSYNALVDLDYQTFIKHSKKFLSPDHTKRIEVLVTGKGENK